MRLCILVFLLLSRAALAQDSLADLVRTTKVDSIKVIAWLRMGEQLGDSEPRRALGYGIQAMNWSKKVGYDKGLLKAYRQVAYIYSNLSRYDSMLHYSQKYYDLAKINKDDYHMGLALFNMGEGYKQIGRYEESLDHTFRAIPHLKKYPDVEARLYSGLQSTYYLLKQYDKSIQYGLTGIGLARKSDNSGVLMILLANMGHCYSDMNKFEAADLLYDETIALGLKYDNKYAQNIAYQGKVGLALKQGRVSDIRVFSLRTLALSQDLGDPSGLCASYHNLGLHAFMTLDLQKAEAMERAALELAKKHEFREFECRILFILSLVYAGKHDMQRSMALSQEADSSFSAIFSASVAGKEAELRTVYETQLKEEQILVQQAQLKQKTTENTLLLGAGVGMILLGALAYRNYRQHRKLQQTRIEDLETEKQLTATEAVLKGEEQERTRLAKDLHDGLGGMLSGIKYSLSSMKENLVLRPDHALAFERSLDMLDSSIREMRRVAHNMMPEMLLKYGLDTALSEFCREISASEIAQINYQSMGIEEMDQSIAVSVYRICQELVHNALKHGQAKNILVQLHVHDGVLALTVEDDGKGFEVKTLAENTGMGWQNIQSRVELLKGKWDLQSEKGSSILIEIPL